MEKQYISDIIRNDYKNWNSFNRSCQNILISAPQGSGKTHFIMNELLTHCAENGKKILYLADSSTKLSELNDITAVMPPQKKELMHIVRYQDFARWVRRCTYISITYGYEIANAALNAASPYGSFFTAEISMALFCTIFPAGIKTPTGSWTNWQKLEVKYHDMRRSARDGSSTFVCTFTYGQYSTFARLRKSPQLFPSFYDYVAVDDIYRLLSDGSFSFDSIDVMKTLIQTAPARSSNIFMTSLPINRDPAVAETLDYLLKLLGCPAVSRKYALPLDNESLTGHVIIGDSELADAISESGSDRWLIYTDSKRHAQKLSATLKWAGVSSAFISDKAEDGESFPKCIITTSLYDEEIRETDRISHIAICTYDNSELLRMLSRRADTSENGKSDIWIYERTVKEVEIYKNKLADKQMIIDEAAAIAYNMGAHEVGEWKKFHFVSKYCNNRRMFDRIGGIVRFTSNGIELNPIAMFRNSIMLRNCEELLDNPHWESSVARLQLSLIGIDYHPQQLFFSRLSSLLQSKIGTKMDNDQLKTLKKQLNEVIKKINTASSYPMKKVNETSATSAINEWLCGAGIKMRIATAISEKHNKKRLYEIVALNDKDFEEFDRACHQKYYPHIPYHNEVIW